MIKVDDVQIELNSELDFRIRLEIINNARTLLTIPKGTCPLDRDKGVDYSIIGKPLPVAKSAYTIQAIELIDKYEPRATVEEILFNVVDGSLVPKVVLTYNGY